MMISVWRGGAYDYYAVDGEGAETPIPRHLHKSDWIAPVEAAWNIPFGAKLIGRGDIPKGMIASNGGTALGDFIPDVPTAGYIIGGAILLWWFFKRQ